MSDDDKKDEKKNGPDDDEEDEDEKEGDDEEGDEDDEDEETDTEAEFRLLYKDSKEAEGRFKELAQQAEQAGEAGIAKIYREVSGNILGLLGDTIASAGHALTELEERGGGGGGDDSHLSDEDAVEYLAYFRAAQKVCDDLLKDMPAYAREARSAIEEFRTATLDRIKYTKDISDVEDDEVTAALQGGAAPTGSA